MPTGTSIRYPSPMLAFAAAVLCILPAAASVGAQRVAHPGSKVSFPPSMDNPGIVIFDPVSVGTAKSANDFGIGCSRWLFLHVGGQPELGKTPLWRSVDRVRREMQKSSLSLTAADAARAARLLGATHLVTGTLSGGPTITLTYRVQKATDKAPLGAPITVSGTPDQVVAALPEAARKICNTVGVRNPALPKSVELMAAELQRLGSEIWTVTPDSAFAHSTRLADLRKKSPLADLICMNYLEPQEQMALDEMCRAVLAMAPDNVLAIGECSFAAPRILAQQKQRIIALARAHPNSFCLSLADGVAHAAASDFPGWHAAVQRGLQISPDSADACLALAAEVNAEAGDRRKARFASQMSPADWQYIQPRYAEWERLAKKATEIDPKYGLAWLRLATSATFNGDPQTADTAMWKALALMKGSPMTYEWGLEMYQAKWGGDEAKRRKVAGLAVTDPYPYTGFMVRASSLLLGQGYPDLSKVLLGRGIAALKKAVQQNPNDPMLLEPLAKGLGGFGDVAGSVDAYRRLVRLRPNNAAFADEYARTLYAVGNVPEALNQYKEASRLDPANATYKYWTAFVLQYQKHYVEAEKILRDVIKMSPNYADAHAVLANTLFELGKYEPALKEYDEAIRLRPTVGGLVARKGYIYIKMGQFDKAVEVAEMALRVTRDEIAALNVLSMAYLGKNDFKRAEEYARRAVFVSPNDGYSKLNLGNALIKLGKKNEARKEWQRVLTLDRGKFAPEARKQLAANP